MSMQLDWRNCRNCQAMFFNGFPDKGRCPAGGGHDAAQSFNFVLPNDVPTVLDFDFNPIVFDGRVPVGGFAHLTIRQDGSFTFLGHFHDSGALEFNVALAWVVKDSQNLVYAFQHSGHVAGTFQAGSRDDDWRLDSRDDNIANNWANLGAGRSAIVKAEANVDMVNLTNALIGLAGVVLGVAALVVA